MWRLSALLAALLLGGPAFAGSETTTAVPNTGTTNVAGFVCFTTQFCTAHVIIDNTGTEKGTAGNPLTINGTGAGSALPVTGTFWQATQPVSGTVSITGSVTTTSGGVAQGSTTATQQGPLNQAAVVSGVQTFTPGQTNPLTQGANGYLNVEAPAAQLITSGSSAPGVDPGMGIVSLCQYGTPTVNAAQTVAIQCGPDGGLKTSAGTVAPATAVGTIAGMPLFGVYLAAPPTATDATWNGLTTDINRNLNVNVAAGAAANAAAGTIGSTPPTAADYQGIKIGANLQGQTGTNVASTNAGDVNVALINGVAPVLGNGTAAGAIRVTNASDSTSQVAISQGTPGTSNGVSPVLATTGGWTPKLLNQLGATAVAIKASAGQLGVLYCYNPNSTVAYVQIFNATTASIVSGGGVGSVTPVQSYGIPPTQNGGYPLGFPGMQFSTAISAAATTTATNGTGPTIPIDCNAGWN